VFRNAEKLFRSASRYRQGIKIAGVDEGGVVW